MGKYMFLATIADGKQGCFWQLPNYWGEVTKCKNSTQARFWMGFHWVGPWALVEFVPRKEECIWKKGEDPHPQDKNQHLDFTKDPRPLYYKTPPCAFYHKNVCSKAVFGP